MFEKSIGDYGTNPGMALCPVFEGVQLRAYNDNILEHKFVQCLRRRVKPIILSRGGYPREVPWFVMNPNTARVGFAECGAFSGGGGFLLRPAFDVFHDALNEYRRFFETHPDLFAGLDSYAPIGVLAWPEQHWYEYRAHMMTVRALTSALTEAHVLFDYVPESLLDDVRLRRYAAVVAPDLPYVSNAQLQLLTQYVKGGGHLLVLGDFAKYDEAMRERKRDASREGEAPAEPLALGSAGASPSPMAASGAPQRLGQGTVTRCASVHEISSALSSVLGAEPSALSCPDAQRGPHVKVNAFRASDRIIVHLVNYNVALGLKATEPEAVDGLSLSLPLPDGLKAASATSYAPDEPQAAPLPVQTASGRAQVRLPALRIYRVVELRLGK